MPPHGKKASRTRTLLGLALIVAALLLLLALLEGPNSRLGCEPLAPVAAQPPTAPELGREPVELDAPPRVAQQVRAIPPTLHGIVFDKRTREPVPWVDLVLNCGTATCKLRTGKDGRFSTTTEFPPGRIEAIVSDDGEEISRERQNLERALRPQGWEIPTDIGPTVPIHTFDDKPPTPDAAWRVRLVEGRFPFGSAGELQVRGDALVVPEELDERDWGTRSVRFEGDDVFVRWPRIRFQPESSWYPVLKLKSEVRYEKAETDIKSTRGIQRRADVRTTPFAVVSGRVEVQGEAGGGNCTVLVQEDVEADAVSQEHIPFFERALVKDSTYKIETPAFCKLRFVAWAQRHLTVVARTTVQRGTETGPDLRLFTMFQTSRDTRLDPRASFGREPEGKQLLRLRLTDAAPLSEAWLFDVSIVKTLDISSLPSGDYRIENIGVDGNPAISETWNDHPLPASLLQSSRAISQPVFPHRVQTTGGVAVEQLELTAGPAGSLQTVKQTKADLVWHVAGSNAAVFTLWGPKLAPTLLRESDFLPLGQESVATVQPTRGWGVLLAFRADDPVLLAATRDSKLKMRREQGAKKDKEPFAMPPVPGVRVTYKGVTMGTSDGDGSALAIYVAQPDQLSLKAPGWKVSALERMPGAGSRWWVWMKRDP